MEKLIEQIKLKADSWDNSTKETRARKGAYVDCLMMVKEASKNIVQKEASKNIVQNEDWANPFCQIRETATGKVIKNFGVTVHRT